MLGIVCHVFSNHLCLSVVHPLSSLSCAVYVLFGRPYFRCPCKGSHRSSSLIISSLLRQQCPEKRILCSLIVIVIFGIFPYIFESTDHDVNVRIGQAWAALNNMTSIWKSNLSVKLKKNVFRATVESILVYGSITWILTSSLEKKIDGAYTRCYALP